MSDYSLTQDFNKAVELCLRKVGDTVIAPYFQALKTEDISYKSSPKDPVSIADKKAEAELKARLLEILPQALFIGEEEYTDTPGILDHLGQTESPVWVVDPIDGTQNFVDGKEGFGIMVALIEGGRITGAWFYEVCSKRVTSWATGHPVLENGLPVAPFKERSAPSCYKGTIGWKLFDYISSDEIDPGDDISVIPAREPSIITYPWLLKGDIDFLVFRITMPWDHLPGLAMAWAHGGVSSNWDGQPFDPATTDRGLIIARDEACLRHVQDKLVKPVNDKIKVMLK